MINLNKHLDLLGKRVADRVTGFKGVVATVSFDLYGCIQAIVNPGTDAEGKLRDSQWFDVNRLRVIDTQPVMPRPDFEWAPQAIAEGRKGPAERPNTCKV
ncbi:MAG TPA: hypothetical protein VN624_19505 [Rhodanobacter sp.]|nr:hypothetical protein [Rhodanobacter sp.]